MNKEQAAAEWATSHAADEWRWSPEEKSPMMDDIIDSLNEAFVDGWDVSRQMSENYLEENTDKIKALLGEE
jgi:hypothetical protein